jgi:antitoxin component of MazEF toxin-antitoxin module
MSLRMPQSLAKRLGVETGEAVLRYELMEEQALSLGRAGRKVEAALAALRAHPGEEGRAELLKAAADAVWSFTVQREACGLRDHARLVVEYDIPREVVIRIGAR